jgi:hypothetical protein
VRKHIGSFESEEDAVREYDTVAMKHGMATHINFPSECRNGEGGADPSLEVVHLAAANLGVAVDPPFVSIQAAGTEQVGPAPSSSKRARGSSRLRGVDWRQQPSN